MKVFGDCDLTEGGRLAPDQLIHTCGDNPVSVNKVPGQVTLAVSFVRAIFEQGDLVALLSTGGRREVLGVLDAEPGLGHTALSKTPQKQTRVESRL